MTRPASRANRISGPRRWAWLVFLAGGLGVAVLAAVVDDEAALAPALTVMGVLSAGAILLGVRVNGPRHRLPWLLLATCTALTTAGVVLIPWAGDAGLLGEILTGIGALAGFAGFGLLVRGRIPGGDRAALLDASILAAGIGVLIWAFGFGPALSSNGPGSVVAVVVFYPSIIAFGLVARLWFLRGPHRPATRLIALTVVASNAIIIIELARGSVEGTNLVGVYLLARFAQLALSGAAALQPSMAITPERQVADPHQIGPGRIIALGAALLVNPATLVIQGLLGRQIDPAPYLIGGVVIGLLVIARLGDALGQLGDSLHERDSLMRLLRHQALYDDLTGLPNRILFIDQLATQFAARTAAQPIAVLMIDLDNFKAVNDSYGHEAGDDLLVAVGQRLRRAIREGDTVARLGGDEFVVLLAGGEDAFVPVRVAERILALLADPFEIGGRSLSGRASVGVAVSLADERSPDELVRNADLAMYIAKSRGKGRLELFEPSMQGAATTQLELQADLAAGIGRGELRLHYQAVVDLRSGQTVGYEALVRWQRDDRLVPPGEFIGLAESSGLIGPLTEWVLLEACRTMARWGEPATRPWVSINLSPSQLGRKEVVALIRGALDSSGLPADRLVIEITESSLVETELARTAIERLSAVGVRLAIDDFGTGYSALSYLATLPIDIVKVDRSFVIALERHGPEEAVAAAIITLARRLGMATIGEGIETAVQLNELIGLGCDLGQGFLLGRPAAREDLGPEPAVRRLPRRPVDPTAPAILPLPRPA